MGWEIFWTLVLIVVNGFFVAAEYAIVKVRASQIEIKVKTGSKIAQIVKHIIGNVRGYLLAVQIGITVSSLALGWMGVMLIGSLFIDAFGWSENLGYGLAFLAVVLIHVIFCEWIPKAIAMRRPIGTAMSAALPLRALYLILGPITWLLNGVVHFLLRLVGFRADISEVYHSAEELQHLLDQGKESGALDTSEHELIKNVFDFNERIVKNIMVPRNKISAVEMDCPVDQFLEKITAEGYSRIPIYDDSIDQIIGVVHTKDLLPIISNGKELVLKNIIRKPYFIPETKKINDLMAEFQQKRIQLAIVLDEFGGTAGMVTLEDIVEELVGEIQDEYDEEIPVVERISETEYMVDAGANVHDVNELLPLELPESSDYDTVSGLVSDLFDRIPDVGEHMEFHGYNFIIMKKTQQNIEFVKLELIDTSDDQDIE